MTDAVPPFTYRFVGEEGLEAIRPLWLKLKAYHSPMLSRFAGEKPPFDFGPRKQELLAKGAAGKMRIELVSVAPVAAEIAFCVTTLSASGRGEIDSLFVEESCRGRGIGSELIRRALGWLESMGATRKVVSVAHANEEALALYQRHGFHPRLILLEQSQDNVE